MAEGDDSVAMTETLWGKYRDLLTELEKRGDYQALANVYQDLARDLYWEGRQFFYIAQKAMRMLLYDLHRNSCVEKVMIMTRKHGACEFCMHLEGKVYSVRDALMEMPLPVKECSRLLSSIAHEAGFCNCTYVPHIEEEGYEDAASRLR